MSLSDENSKFSPDANGPALLPPPVKPAKSVLRAIEALDAAEARGPGEAARPEARKCEAPVIEAVAIEQKAAEPKPVREPQAEARKPAEAPKVEPVKADAVKAEPLKPLRASAFRPNGAAAQSPAPSRRHAWLMRAAGVTVLLGAGWIAAAQVSSGDFNPFGASKPAIAQLSPIDQLRLDLKQVVGDLTTIRAQLGRLGSPEHRARQTAELDSLKRSLADLSRRIEQGRTAQTAAAADLGARLDRARNDDARQREEISERIARIERQISDGRPTATQASLPQPNNSTVVPRVAIAPPPPAAASEPSQRKPQGLAGYVVREVYNGMALIEGRNGYLEVYPGAFVPGAGRVQQITRRSGQWVVVTSNGVIGPQVE